jgi:hypothetical protein
MSDAHSTDRAWSVYFIQMGDGGPIKIGITNQGIGKRLGALQTASPYPLHVRAILPVDSPADELAIHERFRSIRMLGEWFLPEPELLRFIGRVLDHGKAAINGTLGGISVVRHDGDEKNPVRWNPWNKVVQDHRNGTIHHAATDRERRNRGLPSWSQSLFLKECRQPPVF